MSRTTIDNTAAIIPGQSLGGLALNTSIADVSEMLMGIGVWKPGSCRLAALFEAAYRLDEHAIEIAADVRTGKIFRLSAFPGYSGMLFQQVGVGMKIGDAVRTNPDFYYDEAEELVMNRSVPGVALSVREPDPDPSIVSSLLVDSISVFLPNIDSVEVQKGRW